MQKLSLNITITHITSFAQIYYYDRSLTLRNSLSQPKSPAQGYLSYFLINSNGIANKKTWSQFFPLQKTPPSNITWSMRGKGKFICKYLIHHYKF